MLPRSDVFDVAASGEFRPNLLRFANQGDNVEPYVRQPIMAAPDPSGTGADAL
jgi:hypothetical protein